MKLATRLAAAACLAALVQACGSPASRFYTLEPDTSVERTPVAAPIRVIVGPVTIPDLVDRPQIVTRVSANEVKINEFARWAEPLKADIARVLAADLATILASDQVTALDSAPNAEGAWRVRVNVMRFDSEPAGVSIDALWAVQPPGKQPPVAGRSAVHESVIGEGIEALVAAHNRALAAVSRDIALAIRSQPGH